MPFDSGPSLDIGPIPSRVLPYAREAGCPYTSSRGSQLGETIKVEPSRSNSLTRVAMASDLNCLTSVTLSAWCFGLFRVYHAKRRGALARFCKVKPFRSKTAAQQFANSGGPARHALAKPPVLDCSQLLRLQHDLHPNIPISL